MLQSLRSGIAVAVVFVAALAAVSLAGCQKEGTTDDEEHFSFEGFTEEQCNACAASCPACASAKVSGCTVLVDETDECTTCMNSCLTGTESTTEPMGTDMTEPMGTDMSTEPMGTDMTPPPVSRLDLGPDAPPVAFPAATTGATAAAGG